MTTRTTSTGVVLRSVPPPRETRTFDEILASYAIIERKAWADLHALDYVGGW